MTKRWWTNSNFTQMCFLNRATPSLFVSFTRTSQHFQKELKHHAAITQMWTSKLLCCIFLHLISIHSSNLATTSWCRSQRFLHRQIVLKIAKMEQIVLPLTNHKLFPPTSSMATFAPDVRDNQTEVNEHELTMPQRCEAAWTPSPEACGQIYIYDLNLQINQWKHSIEKPMKREGICSKNLWVTHPPQKPDSPIKLTDLACAADWICEVGENMSCRLGDDDEWKWLKQYMQLTL